MKFLSCDVLLELFISKSCFYVMHVCDVACGTWHILALTTGE